MMVPVMLLRLYRILLTLQVSAGWMGLMIDVTTMVAVPVELVTPIFSNQLQSLLADHTQINVLLVWRKTDSNEHGVEMMKHLAYLYLVDPSIHFHYLLYSPSVLPASITIEHFPAILILTRGEVFQYEYEVERIGVTYIEEDEDEEDEEDEDKEDPQMEETQEPQLLESGVMDLLNDLAGTALNAQGSSSSLPGYVPSIVKLLKSVQSYDKATLDLIQTAIGAITDFETQKLYQSAYDLLLSKGSKGIWKEWRRVFDETRQQEDDSLVAYKNILRLFAKNFEVEFGENEEL